MIRASIVRNGTCYSITVRQGSKMVESKTYDYIPVRVAKEYAEHQLRRLDPSATLGEWKHGVSPDGLKTWNITQA